MTPAESPQLNKNLAFVANDTWQGIPSLTIEPSPINSLLNVRMHFRDSFISTRTYVRLNSNNPIPENPSVPQIEIISSSNWVFRIPEQKLGLNPGTYAWQIETVDSAGHIQTYLQGTLQVYSDIVLP